MADSSQEISLSWTPPTGNAPLTSYLLFRGPSPTNLVQYQQVYSTATSFNDYYLTPSTKYCYGVEAAAGGLMSQMSNIVCAVTLAAPSQGFATAGTLPKMGWA